MLVYQHLDESQVSLDVSTVSSMSSTMPPTEQLAQLREQYRLLQEKLLQVEDERNFLEGASILSEVDGDCEIKYSDSLIKLVGELRQEKNKNREVCRTG